MARTARSGRLPDLEADEPLRLLVDDVDACHGRAARPVAAEADEGVDRVRVSLEDRLDAAVGAIADPAADGARSRRAGHRETEADALHTALDADPATHRQHAGYGRSDACGRGRGRSAPPRHPGR